MTNKYPKPEILVDVYGNKPPKAANPSAATA